MTVSFTDKYNVISAIPSYILVYFINIFQVEQTRELGSRFERYRQVFVTCG